MEVHRNPLLSFRSRHDAIGLESRSNARSYGSQVKNKAELQVAASPSWELFFYCWVLEPDRPLSRKGSVARVGHGWAVTQKRMKEFSPCARDVHSSEKCDRRKFIQINGKLGMNLLEPHTALSQKGKCH